MLEDASSIFTNTGTSTSLSTAMGMGSTTGRAIRHLGALVVRGTLKEVTIRRRLAQIESLWNGHKGLKTWAASELIKSHYSDLIELSQYVIVHLQKD